MAATTCVCIDAASAVELQWRASSRIIAHSSAWEAPPPPSSAGTPAANTPRSFSAL